MFWHIRAYSGLNWPCWEPALVSLRSFGHRILGSSERSGVLRLSRLEDAPAELKGSGSKKGRNDRPFTAHTLIFRIRGHYLGHFGGPGSFATASFAHAEGAQHLRFLFWLRKPCLRLLKPETSHVGYLDPLRHVLVFEIATCKPLILGSWTL